MTSMFSQRAISKDLLSHAQLYNKPDFDPLELVTYLKQKTSSTYEAAEVIFYWIASHTSCQGDGSIILEIPPRDSTLEKQLAKYGAGYSSLYKLLCDAANIECYTVSGYAKGYGFDSRESLVKPNHTWNVVNLDTAYRSIDVMWGSGRLEPVNDYYAFKKRISMKEVFPLQKNFLKEHLPADPRWQLMNHTWSMDNFYLRDTTIKEDVFYNYQDSISLIRNSSSGESQRLQAVAAYEFNRSNDNLKQVADAYYASAYDLSQGKYKREQLLKAEYYYERALMHYSNVDGFEENIGFAKRNIFQGQEYVKYRLKAKR